MKTRKLRLEELEGRDCPSAALFNGTLYFVANGDQAHTMLVRYADPSHGVIEAVQDGVVEGRFLAGQVNYIYMLGGAGADTLRNDTAVSGYMNGRQGDDVLVGGTGHNWFDAYAGWKGDEGSDTITANEGDIVFAGPSDHVTYRPRG